MRSRKPRNLFIREPIIKGLLGITARSLTEPRRFFVSSDSNGLAVFPYPMIRPLFFALSFFALLIPCLLFYAFCGCQAYEYLRKPEAINAPTSCGWAVPK